MSTPDPTTTRPKNLPRNDVPPPEAPPPDSASSPEALRMSPPVSPHSHTKERRRRRRRRNPVSRLLRLLPWQLFLVLAILAVIVPTAAVAVFATDSYARVQESFTSLQRVVETLDGRAFTDFSLEDLERLQFSVHNFEGSLERARQQTGLLRRLSGLVPSSRSLFGLLDAAQPLVRASRNMLEGAQPALTFLIRGQQEGTVTARISSGERLIELLQAGQSRFATANLDLEEARLAIEGIDLTGISGERLSQYQQLVGYYEQIRSMNQIIQSMPDLVTSAFALEVPKNYLILSQNNDELRPSGGYISTYGWLRLRRFRITDYDYNETSPISPNPPPSAMLNELDVPSWWFKSRVPIMAAWSGSWYADYPNTAKMAAWYYDNGLNPRSPVDGVIAIDVTGFQYLLEGLGAVEMPDYGVTITPANFRETIYRIRAEGADKHKVFVTEIYRRILAKWQTISQESSIPLLNAALKGLQTKHIMIYFTDPKLNEVMDLLGWSGKQTFGEGDYLLLSDANLGNKSNSSVLRALTYSVSISPEGDLTSRAILDYSYPSEVADKDPAVAPEHYGDQKDYYSLIQLYTPAGTVLQSTENLQSEAAIDAHEQYTVLATGILVRFDTNERFEFNYTVPRKVSAFGSYQRYRLLIQKQPGTQGDQVNVQVNLPAGSRVISTSIPPTDSFVLDNPILEFQFTLTADREIEIIYQQ
ncbi:MAG: DUF4012 domain-containing protein [Anaerolinea sp.]|nr:DUF4012 domain-containing protein [Anaerolinea sp.]